MTAFATPKTGNFCWVEANLDNLEKARGFYGELLGWSAQTMPMGDGEYTIFHIDGKHTAGLMKLPEQAKKMGAPPHWMNYVAVDNTAAATEKAKGLGAKVIVPPMQAGPGTMSIIQDPTGGMLALWNTTTPMGSFLWQEPRSLCWVELHSTDVETAKTFYGAAFGWTFDTMPMGDFNYFVIKNGTEGIGGMMQQPKEMKGAPSTWGAYFSVDDCDGTVAKAVKMGGNVIVPPSDIPDVGRFAVLADPDGAVFSILKGTPA